MIFSSCILTDQSVVLHVHFLHGEMASICTDGAAAFTVDLIIVDCPHFEETIFMACWVTFLETIAVVCQIVLAFLNAIGIVI
jgi:hypothetical protein